METNRIPIATISGSYGFGWDKMKQHFLYLFLVAVIVGFANAPTSMVKDSEIAETAGMVLLQILVAAYSFLVLPVIKYGGDLQYLKGMRDEKIEVSEMFDGFKSNYLNIILANLLTFAIIGLGIVFLIVPGIIFGCRLVFVPYLVMDKNMDPVAAVEKSWAMTRGHGWKIFGMGLLAILVFILGFLCLIVGVFFALMWIGTAFASLYYAIDLEEQNALNMNGDETEELS